MDKLFKTYQVEGMIGRSPLMLQVFARILDYHRIYSWGKFDTAKSIWNS